MKGKKHDHNKETHHIHHDKNFVFPVRAINNDLPVNLKIMSTFEKVDKTDVRNNLRKSYSIQFKSSEAPNNAPNVEWRYDSKELRDLDYKELKDRVATPLI